jgi:hypothetical protein
MAIKTKIAGQSGPDSSPQVVIAAWDDARAATSVTDLMNAAIAVADVDIFGVPIAGVSNIDQRTDWMCFFTISYRTPSVGTTINPPAEPTVGTAVRRFPGAAAKAKKMKHFLSQGTVYQYNGSTTVDVTSSYGYASWALNAHIVPGVGFPPQETTIEPYAESWSVQYLVENGDVDYVYIAAVRDAASRGVFNSLTFDGQDPGTVQFVRFSAMPRTDEYWEYDYGFADVAERVNVEAGGDVVIPSVLGSEYYWFRERKTFDETGNVIETEPDIVVLGQVWDMEDLDTLLDLPALP